MPKQLPNTHTAINNWMVMQHDVLTGTYPDPDLDLDLGHVEVITYKCMMIDWSMAIHVTCHEWALHATAGLQQELKGRGFPTIQVGRSSFI